MAFWFYKPGQGYWTRTLSLLGTMVLTVAGALWIRRELTVLQTQYAIYIQWGVAAAIIVVLGALAIWVLNRPRVVEFMIATEAEMKKVNWPSRKEIIGSTGVVIGGTFLMALFLWTVSMIFLTFFQMIGILEGPA